jgi:hypothetical protein
MKEIYTRRFAVNALYYWHQYGPIRMLACSVIALVGLTAAMLGMTFLYFSQTLKRMVINTNRIEEWLVEDLRIARGMPIKQMLIQKSWIYRTFFLKSK